MVKEGPHCQEKYRLLYLLKSIVIHGWYVPLLNVYIILIIHKTT